MRHRLGLLLPLVLASIGVGLLVGCIYIPTFGAAVSGRNVAKQVGDARSRKPVRVGTSTRDDVLRLLGAPQASKADGTGVAYMWSVRNGVAVWPLCFQAESIIGYRTLVLRFDEAGRMKSYEVLKSDTPVVLNLGGTHHALPSDFRNANQQQTPAPTSKP
jgi:hypothetical protein